MSKSPAKPVALAVAATLGGLALSGAAFAMTPLASGYMVSANASQDAAATEAATDAKADSKAGEGRCGMSHADSDGDGRISAEEFAASHPEKDASYFSAMDGNGDGFVDKAEHDAHHAGKKAGSDADADTDKAAQEGKCGEGKCGGSGACGGVA
ncbi:HvfA family oxazolone/thioamide-modified RiPP metallophore [Luteimonas changyuni]|uniref:HvfA family oxazolone/thioamide-modified RiPP metallophore n=1 Tax=Luteimonas sp. MJ145 TaxID=3129234 RepID=UPI0031B9C2D9